MTEFSSSTYLCDSSREYAIYVCSQRAIPSVIDGLKHGQRMALWVLRTRADKIKTFALSGLLGFERLYVHGEASANGAIGLLAAPYKNNLCLIEGLGQFGSRVAPDKDGIGAPRYTEVRRSKAAEAILYNDLDLVPLIDNYDGSNKQPVHFLPLVPIVLLNGVSGVAIGWSTNILPRSLKSLVDATKAALLDKPIPPLEPHFARYNITVRSTGKTNQWEFDGRAEIVDTSTVRITELPPGMSIESFRAQLNDMEDKETIQNYTDRSTETINITVKMKRGSINDWSEQDAIDYFKLREKVTERIVVVDWCGGAIRTYATAEELVRDFAAWRLGWYTKRFERLLENANYELRYWRALNHLFAVGFPARLGKFENRAEMRDAITTMGARFPVDESQMERLLSLPTYRWTIDYAKIIGKEINALCAAVAEYQDILASPDKLRDIYIKELDAVRNLKV